MKKSVKETKGISKYALGSFLLGLCSIFLVIGLFTGLLAIILGIIAIININRKNQKGKIFAIIGIILGIIFMIINIVYFIFPIFLMSTIFSDIYGHKKILNSSECLDIENPKQKSECIYNKCLNLDKNIEKNGCRLNAMKESNDLSLCEQIDYNEFTNEFVMNELNELCN